ncbi:hypothetical protein R1flu_004231 [Riccia fluitans]|uniref:Uncharacterized protein n=1 Tax=Riccia fluitans TaxID=41844 RepID=A0ABD1YTP3_9MARC
MVSTSCTNSKSPPKSLVIGHKPQNGLAGRGDSDSRQKLQLSPPLLQGLEDALTLFSACCCCSFQQPASLAVDRSPENEKSTSPAIRYSLNPITASEDPPPGHLSLQAKLCSLPAKPRLPALISGSNNTVTSRYNHYMVTCRD